MTLIISLHLVRVVGNLRQVEALRRKQFLCGFVPLDGPALGIEVGGENGEGQIPEMLHMTNTFPSDKPSSEHATEMEDVKSLIHRLFVALHLEDHQIRKERELLQKLDHLKEQLMPLEQVGRRGWGVVSLSFFLIQKHFLLSRVSPVIEEDRHERLGCVCCVCHANKVNSNSIQIIFSSVLFPSCFVCILWVETTTPGHMASTGVEHPLCWLSSELITEKTIVR